MDGKPLGTWTNEELRARIEGLEAAERDGAAGIVAVIFLEVLRGEVARREAASTSTGAAA